MKKLLNLILFISIFSFVGLINVKAVNIKVNPDVVKVGDEFKVTISEVNNNSEYTLTFVETYFEVRKTTCGNRTEITSNCELTIRVNPTAIITQETKIYFILQDLAGYDLKQETFVTIKANQEAPTSSATTTTDQTTSTTTPAVAKSNNANLKTLEIKADDGSNVVLSPIFSSTVYEYEATVVSTVKTIQINAIMEDAKATMIISNNANEELKAGENNRITITVTAEDGTQRPYVINIKREALTADATLKELIIEEDESFKLEENVFNYTVKIDKNVSELTISYVLSDENATVEIEGNEDLKDGSKVRITVIAADGTKKVYTLNIVKNEETTKVNTSNITAEKNPLIIMVLSIVAFGLVGGIIYVIKK